MGKRRIEVIGQILAESRNPASWKPENLGELVDRLFDVGIRQEDLAEALQVSEDRVRLWLDDKDLPTEEEWVPTGNLLVQFLQSPQAQPVFV